MVSCLARRVITCPAENPVMRVEIQCFRLSVEGKNNWNLCKSMVSLRASVNNFWCCQYGKFQRAQWAQPFLIDFNFRWGHVFSCKTETKQNQALHPSGSSYSGHDFLSHVILASCFWSAAGLWVQGHNVQWDREHPFYVLTRRKLPASRWHYDLPHGSASAMPFVAPRLCSSKDSCSKFLHRSMQRSVLEVLGGCTGAYTHTSHISTKCRWATLFGWCNSSWGMNLKLQQNYEYLCFMSLCFRVNRSS